MLIMFQYCILVVHRADTLSALSWWSWKPFRVNPFGVSFDPEDLRIEGNPLRINPAYAIMPYYFFPWVCSTIQLPIVSKASGEMVSSILEYSMGEPVSAV